MTKGEEYKKTGGDAKCAGHGRAFCIIVTLGILIACIAYMMVSDLPGSFVILGILAFAMVIVVSALAILPAFLRGKSGLAGQVIEGRKVLIVGAGAAARLVLRHMDQEGQSEQIVGMVDDDPKKQNQNIMGRRVLGTTDDIIKICENYMVNEILIAVPSAGKQQREHILFVCSKTNCRVKIMPDIHSFVMLQDQHCYPQIRSIRVEDLLRREPVRLNNSRLSDTIRGKTILVTGGGGSIGSELCRQLMRFSPKSLVILDIYENNAYELQQELMCSTEFHVQVEIASVRDEKRMEEIFEKYRPDVVFHAAAHKHVPLMEDNPKEAVKNNVFGTYYVAFQAVKHHAEKFVLISTDKAVNPTSIMGATKRFCEMMVQSMNAMGFTDFCAVRFGNVLGSNGSVMPLFQRQIENGGPVTLTHPDITRYFMTIPEAAQLVLQAAADAKGGEIFVLDMGEPVKIRDLAENMIRLSGLEPYRDINIKITGLRPGEKLFEELRMGEEAIRKTAHNKIFVMQPATYSKGWLGKGLGQLKYAIEQGSEEELRTAMKQLVPTYQTGDKLSEQTEIKATAI